MATKSFLKLLMFLVVLVLVAVVPAKDVTDELGNVYDDEHMLGIPTFDEPRAVLPRDKFVTVTVTDTVCAPPPAGPPTHATGTTTQAPGNPPAPTITTTTSVTSVGTAPGTTGDGPGTTVSETTATGIPLSTENSLVSSETHGIPGTGTQSPSASTVSSGRPSSTHPTSSQSSGHAVTPTSTSSGSHPTSAAPNEAVARGGMHNALLILAATFVGFFMI